MTAALDVAERLVSLLDYPTAASGAILEDCMADRDALPPAAAAALERYAAAVRPLTFRQLQEMYSETFDFNPACTLDAGWHLFGERFERGAFMADARARLASAGIAEAGELPDYLPHLLRLLHRAAPDEMREMQAMLERVVAQLAAALRERGSPYHHLVTAAFCAVSQGSLVCGQ